MLREAWLASGSFVIRLVIKFRYMKGMASGQSSLTRPVLAVTEILRAMNSGCATGNAAG